MAQHAAALGRRQPAQLLAHDRGLRAPHELLCERFVVIGLGDQHRADQTLGAVEPAPQDVAASPGNVEERAEATEARAGELVETAGAVARIELAKQRGVIGAHAQDVDT